MITNFFIPELNNHDVQELWFQQTCHTARATIDLLKDTFGDRIISRFGPVNWPPRSCDLTPLDYFLSPPSGTTTYQLLHRSINHQVADRVAKNDANLTLSPTFRFVSIESPLYCKEWRCLRANITILTLNLEKAKAHPGLLSQRG
ncbi:hypothetical protein TNCV_3734251 [Trichonephila clavipes]|nr:hypothetical protein TNCV_3734251 [Trichonephila clavipes]